MRNLKFKHDVNTWAEANLLYAQMDGPVQLAYNTWLHRHGDDYQVVHYQTPIITYHRDESVTFDAAYVSSTTADRLHHYRPEFVERINRDHGTYRVTLKDHPGVFHMGGPGERRFRVFADRTVVKA